jgi:beta-lactamase class D
MICIALAFFILVAPVVTFGETFIERSEWGHFFTDEGVNGTIVVIDERKNAFGVYEKERAQTRYSPASTFKIPHALFALDAGIIRDEFLTIPWDGTKRHFDSWNKDQTLRSSMRNSVVWVYQKIARTIGEKSEKNYLDKINYGNAELSSSDDAFWLDGSLIISAFEQVSFLQRLYKNELPFPIEHQRLVKDVMIVEAGTDWILRAKTGTFIRSKPALGWYVGWVEWPEGTVFFALNIDMPKEEDYPKRVNITRTILRSIQALPSNK